MAALPESELETLLPRLKAKPVRTASDVDVVSRSNTGTEETPPPTGSGGDFYLTSGSVYMKAVLLSSPMKKLLLEQGRPYLLIGTMPSVLDTVRVMNHSGKTQIAPCKDERRAIFKFYTERPRSLISVRKGSNVRKGAKHIL
ncbi:hypothetical protein MKW98_032089 [Papaver atlanticum]|uniref:Uncharacterized protein n=1 Tax=Papaver atlanticum TaxID=357466 RepID=A0AAD4XCG2_9MAGN|nr:hypothetical protein MKW98_032089 [Papaver atlanticum]